MAWVKLYTNGKRDPQRRYINTETGEKISRRKGDDLTSTQQEKAAAQRAGFQGNFVRSIREKNYAHSSDWVRFGPYTSINEALNDPRIGASEVVVIGARGMMQAQARSGTKGKRGWLGLFSQSEYDALQGKEARAKILNRLSHNLRTVEGYYVWVKRP